MNGDSQAIRTPFLPNALNLESAIDKVSFQANHQKVANAMLKRFGLLVADACNGKEAIEQEKHHKFDLIFMDIQMPKMDGITATKIIRTKDTLESQSAPIVALTANAMPDDVNQCLNSGMNGFISKLMTAQSIEARLKRRLAD